MYKKAMAYLLTVGLMISLSGCQNAGKLSETGGIKDGNSETGQEEMDTAGNENAEDEEVSVNANSANEEDDQEAGNGNTAENDQHPDEESEVKETDEPNALCIAGSNTYISEWTEDYQTMLYNIQYQKLFLIQDEESALAEVFASYNEKMSASMEANAEELKQMAQEPLADDTFFTSLSTTQQYQIVRADDSVFSAWSKIDSYTGGAHPFYIYNGITIDAATGKELQLSDVVTDTSAMAKQLAEQLEDAYDEEAFSDLPITLQSMIQSDTLEWVLGNEGLEFCFAPGNLAPYAVGVISSVIRYDEMPELFNEKYTKTRKQYTRGFSRGDVESIDIDGDGETEKILVYDNRSEYGEIFTDIKIQIDSTDYTFECPAYRYSCYLVHMEEGKWYLYVDSTSDNDYHTLLVFDLNSEGAQEIQRMPGTGFHTQYMADEDEYEYPEEFFTNPEEFKLDVRTDLLSTLWAFSSFRVDADGKAEPKEEYYYFETDRELTSKIDLELEFPENGEKETVPAGSKFSFFRTDNESFVDMKLEDGRICRVEVDDSDWPIMINGSDRDDVFDGMMFAG